MSLLSSKPLSPHQKFYHLVLVAIFLAGCQLPVGDTCSGGGDCSSSSALLGFLFRREVRGRRRGGGGRHGLGVLDAGQEAVPSSLLPSLQDPGISE